MSDTLRQPVDNDSLLGLMNQLVEVPPPSPVAMWPQTSGWAVVALVLSVMLGLGCWGLWRRFRANAYRRAALKALASADHNPTRISQILKRAALVGFGRRRVAALSGQAWVSFLEDTCDGVLFSDSSLRESPYEHNAFQTDPALTEAARVWIRRHRVSETADV